MVILCKKGISMVEKVKLSVCGLIVYNGTVLIVKRSDNDDFLPGIWEFPGGGVEKNESLKQTLIRELQEEIQTDVSTANIKMIGISEEFSDGEKFERDIQFNYEIVFSEKPNITLSSEHSDFDWINKCDERIDDYLKNILKQSDVYKSWVE